MNITNIENKIEFYAPVIIISSITVLLLSYFCKESINKTSNKQIINPILKNDKLQKIEKLETIKEIEENIILGEEELPSYSEVYNKK